jgi:Family of unknown function (DUF6152)
LIGLVTLAVLLVVGPAYARRGDRGAQPGYGAEPVTADSLFEYPDIWAAISSTSGGSRTGVNTEVFATFRRWSIGAADGTAFYLGIDGANCAWQAERHMKTVAIALVLAGALFEALPAAFPAAAHHSFAADFDERKPVSLIGKVVKFEMMNPHSWIHLDVTDADGETVRWEVETGSTNALFRRGWRTDTLKAGDEILVEGYAARDDTFTANARSVRLANGDLISAASSREEDQ